MNFFEHQERARKKTIVLFLYFFLAMALIIFSIDLIFLGLVLYSGDPQFIAWASGTTPTHSAPVAITWDLIVRMFVHLALFVAPAVILVIVIGTVFRLLSLKAGGIAVAELAGATPIDPSTQDFKQRRFINIVEEMSIASGVALPKLYVMEKESSINAFVAGIHPSDTVMVVSQGALDELNRDELQGVVGHEYSHIFNSDMQISVRLIGILAGILLIGQLGTFLLHSLRGRRTHYSSKSSSKKGGDGIVMIFLLGIGLYVVGYIGLFFGRLIKSAISRQRELLADSSSVQFTRNPIGLVGALQKIQQSTVGTYLNSSHAEDISHLCFCPSLSILFTRLLDTHPPLDVRIKELDPKGFYRHELSERPKSAAEQKPKVEPKPVKKNFPFIGIGIIQDSIGNPSDAHVDLAIALLRNIPTSLKEISHNPSKVHYIYFALLLAQEPSQHEKGVEYLKICLSKDELNDIIELNKLIITLDRRAILPLIDISMPAFRKISPEKRRILFNQLEKLSLLDKQDLFEFTLLGIIGKNVEDREPKELRVKYDNFDDVAPSLSILASFIIAANPREEEVQTARFKNFSKELTSHMLTKYPIQELDPSILLPALQELNLLAPLCKEKLIQRCLEAIQDDQKISLEEAELIRGIAACLDCPIPPLIATG